MPFRTTLFQNLPWVGGLNTSVDESMVPPNQLVIADNLIFDTRGSRRKREGIKHNYDNVTTSTNPIVGLHDFWFGTSTRNQRLVSIASNRTIRSYSAGTATSLTDAGTAWSGTLTNACMTTFNNLCIMTVTGSGNVVKKWSGSGNVADLDGTPPQASICGIHYGRLLLNDKTNADRLHYSPTFDHTLWNGNGDSGALDIGVGDGDPDGITAFVSFKGVLFVFKRTKTYKVTGATPETQVVELVSSGVGCVGQNSIAYIDQDDVYFASERGIHSLSATADYGDFESTFVSLDIQKTYRDDLSSTRRKFIKSAYLATINSFAFACSTGSASTNDTIYLYNIPLKAWYRWPNISCESLITVTDSDKKRFYLGTSVTRLSKTFNGTNYDISNAGINTGVPFKVKTGNIFPDNNPYTYKGFKRFILYYRPSGTHQLTVKFKVDNHTVSTDNQLGFSTIVGSDILGSTFVLGSSSLGSAAILGPYSRMVDGHGRGFQIEINQTGVDQSVEIQGFGVEYESEAVSAEPGG